MGSINALPNYVKYYGLPLEGNASTGIVFAIFQVSMTDMPLLTLLNHFLTFLDWPNGRSFVHLDGRLARSPTTHLYGLPWRLRCYHHHQHRNYAVGLHWWPVLVILLRNLRTHCSTALPCGDVSSAIQRNCRRSL